MKKKCENCRHLLTIVECPYEEAGCCDSDSMSMHCFTPKKSINTLEDMLVAVRKYYPLSRIEFGYISVVAVIRCEKCSIFSIISGNGLWGIKNFFTISNNPQDILDIIKAIYNCGKPEEEKVK